MDYYKLFNWYFSKKTLPYWAVVALDCVFVFFSMSIVYAFNTDPMHTLSQFGKLCITMGLYTLFFVVGFRIFRTYSGFIRYSSFVDLLRVAAACVVGVVISLVFKYIIAGHTHVILPVRARDLLLGAILAMLAMWLLRVGVKYIYDSMFARGNVTNIFIFGVKEGGVGIAKSIRNQERKRYVLKGFTTDHESAVGRMLMGVEIYPFDDTLIYAMKKAGATALFVSPLRSEALRSNQHMVDLLIKNGIKIYMMPTEQRWDGHSSIQPQMMQEVNIEDLLPRQQIEVDMESIARLLSGKRIMITGAAGSIGSEMSRQVASFGPCQLVLIDQAETPLHDMRLAMARNFPEIETYTIVADIANKNRMAEIFAEFKPEYVFHAAAYKHVPMMEDNPGESIQNNVEGTRIIADLAVKHGASKFVMISTDKAVNPTNVMGCSKRICEIYVQSLDKALKDGAVRGKTQFVTTRFGNVLGSNGSVIPLFAEQIRKGGPVTVTHPDIIRYFMLIPEACKLVLEAGTMGHGGEIFVFDMGEPVKIVDLAKRMISLSGKEGIEIKFTGLRDGEKLYEEVLNEKETTLPTFHPKIKIAKVREYDYAVVNTMIDILYKSSIEESDMDIVRHMKHIVPEYHSQHSKYEALDHKEEPADKQ